MFQLHEPQTPRLQRHIFVGLTALMVLLPLGACVYLAFSIPDFKGQPRQPDVRMIANFQQYKSDFERLRQMIIEDKGLVGVDDDSTEPRDPQSIGLSPERIAQYRKYFNSWASRADSTQLTTETKSSLLPYH